ncbi:lipase maturation factor family protein [Cnuibacter sp. UC19_7]|uniref:lipase maturation factor family protein n=1 Tax=Cnuibacter sp. UC19_7 TaxID=3350166 RepID=UPI0036703363
MDGVTEWFGAWFGAGDYEFARQMLQRGVAAIYVVAFLSTLAQFPALLGERGLLPVPRHLARGGAAGLPTIFRLYYSDRMLRAVCVVGTLIAASLVAGLPQLGPPWLPLIAFLSLWILYLSIVSVGQTFYGFGWEMLLCEAGFLVAFLGSNEVAPPILVIVLVRWLVFRLEFGAGMIKMRGDRTWRDLTALYYHHETQPMPNPLSRFAHLLPKPVHRLEVLGNHVAQLVVPFLLFAPQPVASIAAGAVILTQLWLVVTGNFAWLNILTIVLAFGAISDDAVHALIPAMPATTSYSSDPAPLYWIVLVMVATALMVALGWPSLQNLFSRRQRMNATFNRLSLMNAYGAFGSVTQERYEVIIEGSTSERPSREEDWLPYEFKGKPGDVRRIPGQFAPYHLRLDWLMWFLALGSPDSGWFRALLGKLLVADRATLRLLRHDPFGGEPPTWIRARVYLYRFTTRTERRETGQWWMRQEVGELVSPSRLG